MKCSSGSMSDVDDYQKVLKGQAAADLSGRCILELTGKDAVRFLNGQVTNDVRSLTPAEAIYAAVTNARGKMDADVWISSFPETIRVDADALLAETLPGRLEKYIIADDVTLTDVSGQWRLYHFLGEGNWPDGKKSRRFGVAGTDVWVPKDDSFSPEIAPDEVWETIRIENGIPRWGRELSVDVLPPEAGLDRWGISYSKGCYIGQEVIARIKSKGHVNRELRVLEGDAMPESLPMELAADGAPVGMMTSVAKSLNREKIVALAFLNRHYLHSLVAPLRTGSNEWKLL